MDTRRPFVVEPLASDLPPVEQAAILPRGFVAGGATAGIKRSGLPDLALIRSTVGPIPAAGVFTTNALPAAPVRLTRDHLATGGGGGLAEAVVSTSGCANAATGDDGDLDQVVVADAVARALGVVRPNVLCMSTGVIGTRLPVGLIESAIVHLAPALTAGPDGLAAAAEALRTTDSRPKIASVAVEQTTAGEVTFPVRVSGIAKGVGMIHPRMATMLAVLLTDATVEPPVLSAMLREATAATWNQLTVDGDTSTNDTVLMLASGATGLPPVVPGTRPHAALARAVTAVARSLARQQARDGEGATTLITCQVSGGGTTAHARAVARSVVASSLVKAAVHGRDPNWGRICAAAGNAGVALDPQRLRIAIAGTLVFEGIPVPFERDEVRAAMDRDEVLLRLDLGAGDATGEAFGCDLTEQYVTENAEYTT